MRKFHWVSNVTGELVEGFADVIRAVYEDFRYYHFINLRWKYSARGW